jgi:hypothetical protein
MPYDTTGGSLNNKVALPNKLYEAMYFKVPIITSKETYLGELVEKYDIGKCIECCSDELLEILNKFDCDMYINSFDGLDNNKYIADKDYLEFRKYINV